MAFAYANALSASPIPAINSFLVGLQRRTVQRKSAVKAKNALKHARFTLRLDGVHHVQERMDQRTWMFVRDRWLE